MNVKSPQGLEPSDRRIRKHIHGKTHTMEVECPPGFTELCRTWCEQLWRDFPLSSKHSEFLPVIKNGRLFIENAPFDFCHDLLLRGQPFTDVKIHTFRGRCSNEEKLKNHLLAIPWELWIPNDNKIDWDVRVDSLKSHLYNEKRIKAQVLEFLKQKFNAPAKTEIQSIAIDIQIEREVLSVALSLGGRRFWQRKQKESLSHAAPLREDVAACLIIRMCELGKLWGLDQQPNYVLNPFCGTGTLLHEAALFLSRLGNLLDRSDTWAYPHLPFFKKAAYLDRQKRILNEVRQEFSEMSDPVLFEAEDVQTDFVSVAQSWFETTGAQNFMSHRAQGVCHNSLVPRPIEGFEFHNGMGWVVSNPPFGIRLSNSAQGGTEKLYREFAHRIASLPKLSSHSDTNMRMSWLGVVLCPDEACWRILQSRLSDWHQKCEHFMLGGLDIRAVYFAKSGKGPASLTARRNF